MSTTPSLRAGRRWLVERQQREIQAHLDRLAPATREGERLQHALDALRAITRLA